MPNSPDRHFTEDEAEITIAEESGKLLKSIFDEAIGQSIS